MRYNSVRRCHRRRPRQRRASRASCMASRPWTTSNPRQSPGRRRGLMSDAQRPRRSLIATLVKGDEVFDVALAKDAKVAFDDVSIFLSAKKKK